MSGRFLRAAAARAYPRVTGFHRRRSWLFMEVAVPLVGTLAMVYVYRGLGAPQRFLGFAVLGGAMLSFWQNILWSMAMQLYWDRDVGNLELYVISPTSMVPVCFGMAVGGAVPTLLRSVLVVVVGSLVFSVRYSGADLLPAAGIFVLTVVALYAMGVALASVFLFYGREAWRLGTAMQEPVYLLAGLYFPLRTLGGFAAVGATLLPMALGLDAIRQLLLPGTPLYIPMAVEVAVLVAQTVLLIGGAGFGLRTMERLARRDGKLVSRGA